MTRSVYWSVALGLLAGLMAVVFVFITSEGSPAMSTIPIDGAIIVIAASFMGNLAMAFVAHRVWVWLQSCRAQSCQRSTAG